MKTIFLAALIVDSQRSTNLPMRFSSRLKNSFSATPSAELDPANHLKIVAVDAESSHWRQDIHTVTIGVAVQDEEEEPRDERRPRRRLGKAQSAIKNANDAINELQLRNIQILNRSDLQQLLPNL